MINTSTKEQTQCKDESATFRRLQRTEFESLVNLFQDLPKVAPIYHLNGTLFHSEEHQLTQHYLWLEFLKEHHWTLEEFVQESEKRSIIRAVRDFNTGNQFPIELVKRAERFFPNAKFTQAKIELE